MTPFTDGDRLVVAVLPKGEDEQVRATLKSFNGSVYLDLRAYYLADSNTWLPTKKGITFNFERLPELMEALQAAEANVGPAGVIRRPTTDPDLGPRYGHGKRLHRSYRDTQEESR